MPCVSCSHPRGDVRARFALYDVRYGARVRRVRISAGYVREDDHEPRINSRVRADASYCRVVHIVP